MAMTIEVGNGVAIRRSLLQSQKKTINFTHRLTVIFRIIDLCNLEFSHARSWGIYPQTRKNHQGTTVRQID